LVLIAKHFFLASQDENINVLCIIRVMGGGDGRLFKEWATKVPTFPRPRT
jgi:hypothetical protein